MSSFYKGIKIEALTIHDVLKYIPGGRSNAIRADQIARMLGIDDGRTNAKVRKLILDAIEAGELIGSDQTGYYIIQNDREFVECIDGLQTRIAGIKNRIQKLRDNWNAQKKPEQRELNF